MTSLSISHLLQNICLKIVAGLLPLISSVSDIQCIEGRCENLEKTLLEFIPSWRVQQCVNKGHLDLMLLLLMIFIFVRHVEWAFIFYHVKDWCVFMWKMELSTFVTLTLFPVLAKTWIPKLGCWHLQRHVGN